MGPRKSVWEWRELYDWNTLDKVQKRGGEGEIEGLESPKVMGPQ